MNSRVVSVLLFVFVGAILIPTSASAQCGQCYEYPIAGLHKAPEQGGSPEGLVKNPHSISSMGMCEGYHGHSECGPNEEDASLVASLQKGESIEMPALKSFLGRNAGTVSLSKDQSGLEVKACGDLEGVSFVPLPRETWRLLTAAAITSGNP